MLYRNYIKPPLDIFTAIVAFIVFSPIFLTVLIILLFYNNGKPFYYHHRPGKNEKIFKIIKFKSMTDKKDKNGEFLPFHMRLTKFGKFIRKTSLDELPQLINVIQGDMSFVGPRPLVIEYLPIYNKTQARRHEVMPGITGWAQVNGRNCISWEKKFELDVFYVDNQSFLLDMKILFLTVYKVIKKKDVNASEDLNMTNFGDVKVNI